MSEHDGALVDWGEFNRTRGELGADFVRILGYFREDGVKSLAAIEDAMRKRNAVAMVVPAHTLKGDALQFGATALAAIAEVVEMTSRRCVEYHDCPDEVVAEVARLRPLFNDTMVQFQQALSPLATRRAPAFGRKAVGLG